MPVLADGQVQGYVAAQFVFTADARALRQMTVKPHPYVRDEALRTIYSNTKVDFTKLERIDIDGLLKTIRTNVNTRFGGAFPLPQAAGAAYPEAILAIAAGERPPARVGDHEAGVVMTRFLDQTILRREPHGLAPLSRVH